MRIGLQVPRFTWPDAPTLIGPKLAEIGRTADEAGFASLWVMDHFFQIGTVGEVEEPMLEGYSALNFLAGITDRVKLGTLVTGVHYRYPGILLKTVTTLDVLSGGRAYLGIGAGWNERESRGLGVPFPPTAERFERLEEALRIAHQMWSGEIKPYGGKHYHLEEAMNNPPALTRPHPPSWLAEWARRRLCGWSRSTPTLATSSPTGERGRSGTSWMFCGATARTWGRDYEEIERTALGSVNLGPEGMDPDDVIEICEDLGEVGIEHLIINMPNVHEISPLETIGQKVIPAVAEL